MKYFGILETVHKQKNDHYDHHNTSISFVESLLSTSISFVESLLYFEMCKKYRIHSCCFQEANTQKSEIIEMKNKIKELKYTYKSRLSGWAN